MKAPVVQNESLLGPSPAQFAALFPFHFVVDDANRVVQFGDTLAAVCPGLAIGSNLEDHLTIRRPVGATLTAGIGSHLASLFLLQLRTRDLQLRGQILPLPGGRVLFVGSPWITDPQNIQELGISLDSFALHDASLDLIHAVQAQRMAAADHQRLVERLKQQRSELQQANAQLKVREAEATKLSHVAARTHNAVVIMDRDGRIEWVNQSFTRLTGYASGEVLGRTPGSVLQGPDSDQPTVAFMREKVWKAEGFKAELMNYAKDGRRYWVEVEVQPVLDRLFAGSSDLRERMQQDGRLDDSLGAGYMGERTFGAATIGCDTEDPARAEAAIRELLFSSCSFDDEQLERLRRRAIGGFVRGCESVRALAFQHAAEGLEPGDPFVSLRALQSLSAQDVAARRDLLVREENLAACIVHRG